MARWFLIGFGIRAALGVIVTIGLSYDREAGMLYLLDGPTIACLTLLENFVSNRIAGILAGSHPYYIQLNLFASLLWGTIFMGVYRALKIVLRRKKAVSQTGLQGE